MYEGELDSLGMVKIMQYCIACYGVDFGYRKKGEEVIHLVQ